MARPAVECTKAGTCDRNREAELLVVEDVGDEEEGGELALLCTCSNCLFSCSFSTDKISTWRNGKVNFKF